MGMVTVVVDTREQEPYGFDSESIASIRKALPAGDYSIEGFETRVAVERKSMAAHQKSACLPQLSLACRL
jgi:DNA excision repair protein ERCC-4